MKRLLRWFPQEADEPLHISTDRHIYYAWRKVFVVAINYTINDKDSRRFEPVKPVFKSVREKQSVAYFGLHSLKFSTEVISCSNIDLNIFKQSNTEMHATNASCLFSPACKNNHFLLRALVVFRTL